MKLEIIEPIGECFWVKKVLEEIDKIIDSNDHGNIYIFGSLIHNEQVINSLKNHDVKFIKFSKSPLEIEYFLEKQVIYYDNDVLIFSAHGHSEEHEKIMRRYFKNIVDLTCPNIKKMIKTVKENSDKNIVFIGNKNHEETQMIETYGDNVNVYELDGRFVTKSYDPKKSTLVLNQSTLSSFDIENGLDDLKILINSDINRLEICAQVEIRQKKLLEGKDKFSKILILGSKTSSNTLRLYEIAKKSRYAKAYLIEDMYDLSSIHFSSDDSVCLASGTSCTRTFVDQVIEKLSFKLK